MSEVLDKTFDAVLLAAIKGSVVKSVTAGDYQIEKAVTAPLAEALKKKHSDFEKHFDSALSEIMQDGSFKEELKEQARKSLARAVVSGMQSSIDTAVNKLKSDPVRKALILQAINTCLEDFDKGTRA